MENSNLNYLKNLNSNQKKAVLNLDGPCLIVAGAGSGKTRVLTTKVVHIIKEARLSQAKYYVSLLQIKPQKK